MHRVDKNNTDIKESEIIAFSCVRNETLRLPYFLEYHRKLGVDRFIFIDNGSTDGTKDFLLSQKDSFVFYTDESYAGSNCGMDWVNHLIQEFGINHWILTLEPDELLVYPKCEIINLQQLTKYLDQIEVQAMKTFLIDMYSDKAINKTCYKAGEPFLNYCRYFDSNSYYEYGDDNIPTRGGPRDRLFWQGHDRDNRSPYLVNVPLVKWRKDLNYECGTHIISNVKLAPLIGCKQHFKFFSDLYTYAETETQRKEHWDNAAQYESYWDVLRKNLDLCGIYDGSLRYKDSMQLVKLSMMQLPDSFTAFINKHSSKI